MEVSPALSWFAYPTELNTNVGFGVGEDNLYEPSKPVCVEVLVPLMVTVTFETGAPVLESVTLPDTAFCANAVKAPDTNTRTSRNTLVIFWIVFFIKQTVDGFGS